MSSNKDNTIFEKTSFLQGINSPFIEELYFNYLKDPNLIPQSWKDFFIKAGLDNIISMQYGAKEKWEGTLIVLGNKKT